MELVDERYVSVETFRRNGEAVATPVWMAPLAGDRGGFTTNEGSGKVKRIRHDPRVTVTPCDMRGNVAVGSAAVAATAGVVVGGAGFEEVRAAISDKYGLQFAVLQLGNRIGKLFGRQPTNCAVVVTFD